MDGSNPAAALGLGGLLAMRGGGGNDLDALARSRGFKDAATMQAYIAHQRAMTGQNGTGGPVAPQQKISQPAPQQQGSWLSQLLGAKLFGNILNKWNGATGGQ